LKSLSLSVPHTVHTRVSRPTYVRPCLSRSLISFGVLKNVSIRLDLIPAWFSTLETCVLATVLGRWGLLRPSRSVPHLRLSRATIELTPTIVVVCGIFKVGTQHKPNLSDLAQDRIQKCMIILRGNRDSSSATLLVISCGGRGHLSRVGSKRETPPTARGLASGLLETAWLEQRLLSAPCCRTHVVCGVVEWWRREQCHCARSGLSISSASTQAQQQLLHVEWPHPCCWHSNCALKRGELCTLRGQWSRRQH
jgi:hypothetical protein